MVENSPAPANEKPPKRDVVAVEGESIALGDEKVTLVFTPGHTPGAMALIFPVKDGGTTHMAGLFGGTVLTPFGIPRGMEPLYLHPIEHF
jgi:glyoxylase-like metal-dependent hydrolase (beta-lactamase superfamily II)